MWTILLLIVSNCFMTVAWYGHLKWFRAWGLPAVVMVAWLIALPEYCLAIPANRIGHRGGFSTPQLKIIQEGVSILVFLVFTVTVLDEPPRWQDLLGMLLILAGIAVSLLPKFTGAAGA